MKTAKVVIGANYGDEGKGLITDYLAHQSGVDTVIVRFNGGSQAGHTVARPDGVRHVFSHFGSGTIVGCRTHLSRFFIANPITFLKERALLVKKGFNPSVTIDPNTVVTTFYDMLLNQLSEESHGRKASCGLGINETVTRSEIDEFRITILDLIKGKYKEKISAILTDWIPIRLKELEIKDEVISPIGKEILKPGSSSSKMMLLRAEEEGKDFLSKIGVAGDSELLRVDSIIFEGAQGLMLDQNHRNFPWVTRSNTGLTNVLDLLEDADLTLLDVYYVTRAYLTRHGDGPLPNSSDFPIYPDIRDDTNITNAHQGRLRFAPLDTNSLLVELEEDKGKAWDMDLCIFNLAVTCLDQAPTSVQEETISRIKKTGYSILKSYGPTRETVRR